MIDVSFQYEAFADRLSYSDEYDYGAMREEVLSCITHLLKPEV